MRFFFLLFLVPHFIYARFDLDKCDKIYEKSAKECARSAEFIKEWENYAKKWEELAAEQKQATLYLLEDAVACYQKAIAYLDTILNDIASQSKKERHKPWRKQFKIKCEDSRNTISKDLNFLQDFIRTTLRNTIFEKALSLYQESGEKANLAYLKSQNCSTLSIEDLNQINKLYEQAISLVDQALELIAPYGDEQSQSVLIQVLAVYQELANRCKTQAAQLP